MIPIMKEQKQPRFFYGYIIVASASIILLLMWGTISSFGVFFKPMAMELGWTRTMISGAPSLSFLIMGLFGIIAGRLNDRVGPRLVVSICGLFIGLGYLLMSTMTTIWQFYLYYGIIIGIGIGGPNIALSSTIVRWFVKKRGTMSGVFQVGSGLGTWIMPLVANGLILSYNWRTSYIMIALMVSIIIVVASQFLRLDPSQMALMPDGEPTKRGGPSNNMGLSLNEAFHTLQFWLVCIIFFLFLFCVLSIMIHIYPHAVDLGISESFAATILAVIGAISIIGRFLIGAIGDKVGRKKTAVISFTLLTLSCLWLIIADHLWMLYFFAGTFGLAQGGLFSLISPWVADLFGVRSHGAIFGAVNLSGALGSTAGPILAGYLFDTMGSYQSEFIVLTIAGALAVLLSVLVKPVNVKE